MEHNPYQSSEPQGQFEEEPAEEEPREQAAGAEAETAPTEETTEEARKKLPALPTEFAEADVTGDERTMAALAHGSIILTLLTGGFGGLIVAFVIWVVYRDKSQWVANQSLQALIFQIVATLAAYVLGVFAAAAIALSSVLMALLIGLCLFPFALIIGLIALVFPFAATVYGLFGALETYQGRDFKYWWIGDLVSERS